MIVLIDIGNTRTKWLHTNHYGDALDIKDKEIIKIDNSTLVDGYFNKHWLSAKKIILATVNSREITRLIRAWCTENNVTFKQVESEESNHGVICGYHSPDNLGVDRWLALVGVIYLFPQKNVLVVDSGTATTIDFMSANGQHRGGWILPGIDLLYSSLMNNTSNIAVQRSAEKSMCFGDDSMPCVNNGLWAMTVGAIKQGIAETETQNALDIIVLCGGNANSLASLITHPKLIVVEQLIFNGLLQYIND